MKRRANFHPCLKVAKVNSPFFRLMQNRKQHQLKSESFNRTTEAELELGNLNTFSHCQLQKYSGLFIYMKGAKAK